MSKMTKKSRVILILTLIGFAAMEFPGIFFIQHRMEPRIFGLPFIYGYMILCWIYMCILFFYAYKVDWGRSKKKNHSQ